MKLYLHLIPISFILFGCKSNSDNEAFEPKLEVIPANLITRGFEVIKIPSDAINLENLLYLNDNEEYSYLFANRASHKLQWLAADGKIVKEKQLENEGDLGIIPPIENIIKHTKDSIFLINKHGSMLLSGEGNILTVFKPESIDTKGSRKAIHLASGFYSLYNNDEIYMPTSIYGHEPDKGLFFKFNLADKHIELVFQYPEEYKNGYWVGGGYFRFFTCPRPDLGQIIVSFPWSSDLFIYQLDGSMESIATPNIVMPKIIPPAKNIDEYRTMAPTAIDRHIASQFEFGAITYDPFRDVYYRIMEIPTLTDTFQNSEETPFYHQKDFHILVYRGSDFSLIGKSEILPKGTYVKTRNFVRPDGFYLEMVQSEEDKVKYQVFELINF